MFHNEIIESPANISTLVLLKKLKELSIAGNPCSAKAEFNYELICRMPKLQMLDDEAIKELDRDVAMQYYEMNDLDAPEPEV